MKESEIENIKQTIVDNKGVPSNYGWCRITLSSLHSKKDISYILKAIEYICINGYKYEKEYKYDCLKNIWIKN